MIKAAEPTNLIFYQLFESQSSTYTYLIGDPETREAALIDPVLETLERDLKLVEETGLKLKYVLDTHIHADHVTAAGKIRERTGARSGVSENAKVHCVDIELKDGQTLKLGALEIRAIATPGHTDSCMSFVVRDMVFTGDALLIRGTGRTDFQQGSPLKLYESIRGRLFQLPGETRVYPGHDYKGQTASTIELEKKFNPRIGLARTKEEFVQTMSELRLDVPRKIHEAVPANLQCGRKPSERVMNPVFNDGIPEVSVEQVREKLGQVTLLDVREAHEFDGELGHIEGAKLVTLGSDLSTYLQAANKDEEIVFVCRSGGRSGRATVESLNLGYRRTTNMVGGMLRWNEAGFPVKRGF